MGDDLNPYRSPIGLSAPSDDSQGMPRRHVARLGKAALILLAVILLIDSFVDGVAIDPVTGIGRGGYTMLELYLGISRPGMVGLPELLLGCGLLVWLVPWRRLVLRSEMTLRDPGRRSALKNR